MSKEILDTGISVVYEPPGRAPIVEYVLCSPHQIPHLQPAGQVLIAALQYRNCPRLAWPPVQVVA
jgi:hypothetical protein